MKVIAINGSPRKNGNTFHALQAVGAELEKANIEWEVIHIGDKAVRGCIACNGCAKMKNEQCTIATDDVNEWVQKMKEADGIVLGSPVYYSGISGTMKCFLDRVFYVASANNSMFRHKVGAAVVAVRRSGGVVTFDALNHYLHYSEMVIPTSNYWNVTHGLRPGDAEKDGEGTQIMNVLGQNMAWLLQVMAAGREKVADIPRENKVYTNFVR